MTWALYAVLAAFLWAVTNIIDKFVLSRLESRPHIPFIMQGLVGGAAGIILFFVYHPIIISWQSFILLIIATISFLLLNLWYFKAADLTEMSQVIPLFYTAPALIAILAVLVLQETFALHVYFGIGAIIVGAVLISIEKFGNNKVSTKALLYIIGAVIADAILAIILKVLLHIQDYTSAYIFMRLMAFFFLVPFIYTYRNEVSSIYRSKNRTLLGWSVVSELINLSALLFGTIAIADGYVTLASALEATQPLFVLLFVALFSLFLPGVLNEHINRKTVLIKIIAILLIVIGVYLIS